MNELTQFRLKAIVEYDPATGAFTFLQSRGRVKAGTQTNGSLNAAGYRRLRIEGTLHYAHRLAWLYMKGSWPSSLIDHKNENKGDNTFHNLREATNVQNKQNVTSKRVNPGAQKKRDKFQTKIRVDKKYVYVGTFDTAEEASKAYTEAKRTLHPFDSSIPARIR